MVTLRRSGEEFSTLMFMVACQGFELNIRCGCGSTSRSTSVPQPLSTASPKAQDIRALEPPWGWQPMGGADGTRFDERAAVHPQIPYYRVAGLESLKLVRFRANYFGLAFGPPSWLSKAGCAPFETSFDSGCGIIRRLWINE